MQATNGRRPSATIRAFNQLVVLKRLIGDHDVDPAILRAPGGGRVVGHRDVLALPLRADPVGAETRRGQGRAHRIGQTRPVMVYRLVSRSTIEEKVMALQETKRDLVAGVLGEGEASGAAITAEDIRSLMD